jgi:hypothetical protein
LIAKGAWVKAWWQTQLYRQAMAMGDDEQPLDPDPYRLISDESPVRSHIVPYDPNIWKQIKLATG